jgi:hypothetical protein
MFALLGATATKPGRRAVVAALTQSPPAFRRLLQFVQVLAWPAHLRFPMSQRKPGVPG